MTDKQDRGLDGLDEQKRQTLKRLGLGAAFVVPVVTSLSLEGLTISKVEAAAPNGSGVVKKKKKEEPIQCKQPVRESCNLEDCGQDACATGVCQGKPPTCQAA